MATFNHACDFHTLPKSIYIDFFFLSSLEIVIKDNMKMGGA